MLFHVYKIWYAQAYEVDQKYFNNFDELFDYMDDLSEEYLDANVLCNSVGIYIDFDVTQLFYKKEEIK